MQHKRIIQQQTDDRNRKINQENNNKLFNSPGKTKKQEASQGRPHYGLGNNLKKKKKIIVKQTKDHINAVKAHELLFAESPLIKAGRVLKALGGCDMTTMTVGR